MTIKEVLFSATQKLNSKKIASASLDAEVILSFVLNKTREFLYAHNEYELKPNETKKFISLIKRRDKYEPVAYLIGHKEFFGLDFLVNKNVLIPRPESETLVEISIEYLKKIKSPIIADIGTGSGALIISIKKNLPEVKAMAVDISASALKVAKTNAQKNKTKINFFNGNLLLPIKNKKLDLIIANLPYLSDEILKKLKPEIHFEPKRALVAGKHRIDEAFLYGQLFAQYKKYHFTCPIILETHPKTNTLIKKEIKKYFIQPKVIIKKDLALKPRAMIIITNN
ncbi:MAG: peptide chain release factor N(5)-glutamine methyltransferase [bacterium]